MERFSWAAISTSHDPRYWALGWELRTIQKRVIGRVAPDEPRRNEGSLYAPLADLEVGSASNLEYLRADPGEYGGCRDLDRPADARSPTVVPAGTVLKLVAELPDRYLEAMGANVWRSTADGSYYASALEGRWGVEAVLTDDLIVPAETPAVSDPAARDAVLAEVRAETIEYRRANGLPPEGMTVDPRIDVILKQIESIPDVERLALTKAWDRAPIDRREERAELLPPHVQAVCRKTWMLVGQHRGDGTAPTPPLVPPSFPGREPYKHMWPYGGGGNAASCAVAVALAGDALEATRSRWERLNGSISGAWSRAWLEVFPRLPGE